MRAKLWQQNLETLQALLWSPTWSWYIPPPPIIRRSLPQCIIIEHRTHVAFNEYFKVMLQMTGYCYISKSFFSGVSRCGIFSCRCKIPMVINLLEDVNGTCVFYTLPFVLYTVPPKHRLFCYFATFTLNKKSRWLTNELTSPNIKCGKCLGGLIKWMNTTVELLFFVNLIISGS